MTGIKIQDSQQMSEELYKYLFPNDYWIFIIPWSNKEATNAIIEIEEKYYKPGTEANADFIMFILPQNGTILETSKERLPDEELDKMIPKKHDPKADVFCCANEGMTEDGAEMKFFQYIMTEMSTIHQIRRENQ